MKLNYTSNFQAFWVFVWCTLSDYSWQLFTDKQVSFSYVITKYINRVLQKGWLKDQWSQLKTEMPLNWLKHIIECFHLIHLHSWMLKLKFEFKYCISVNEADQSQISRIRMNSFHSFCVPSFKCNHRFFQFISKVTFL